MPATRVDIGIHVTQYEGFDKNAKGARVLQQGGDVAELDAGAGPIGHGADTLAQEGGVEQGIGVHDEGLREAQIWQ